ncbi:MAG: DUF523 domain-containing protein [Erysipelotrichaceae bacterium]
MKILVSACLVGVNCKYNGGNNYHPYLVDFLKDHEYITVCPELLSGMGCPRNCVEQVNERFIDQFGNDVSDIFVKGVNLALSKLKDEDIDLVILQSRSPTCGVNQRYDGSFSGSLINESGLFAKRLKELGYKVIDIKDFKVLGN